MPDAASPLCQYTIKSIHYKNEIILPLYKRDFVPILIQDFD